MKAELTEPKSFKPVSITLTFESQGELDAVRDILDLGDLVEAVTATYGLDKLFPHHIRKVLEQAGATEDSFNALLENFHGVLRKRNRLKQS